MAPNEGSRSEEEGTKRTVYAALAANLLIAAAKFVAGFASGSSAMLAEGSTRWPTPSTRASCS